MRKLNPPILENTLPAFVKSADGVGYLNIPFQLNRSVSSTDFTHIQVLIKSVQSNIELYNEKISVVSSGDLNGIKGYIQLVLNGGDSKNFIPTAGQYYKIQIAFVQSDNTVGYYSNVGVIKCINQPTIFIKDREDTVVNTREYTGVYQNNDITEKVYSYQFNLYDEMGELIETSGEQLHNTEKDEIPTESQDTWIITKTLEPNRTYQVGYSVVTINGYNCAEIRVPVLEINTVAPNIYANLSVKHNFENGYNEISLIGDQSGRYLNGSFVLLRSSTEDDYGSWIEICRYQLHRWDTNTTKIICKDYCLRQGHKYKYAVQAYNSTGLYSNKIENIEGSVLCDFEDCFLYDGEKQLKIRFNPKIGSFKSTILESKMDTLGGKYPFIFRNGNVEYKEFSISGLLSLLSDDNGDFFQFFSEGDLRTRTKTPSTAQMTYSPFGTLLTSENYKLEREYKMQALNWLTNGKPKLFRSSAEGNFIVRLMNTSLSPNDTLGRLLHTFTSTAYEIAEYNYQNLKEYGFAVDSTIEMRDIRYDQIDLLNVRTGITVDEDGTIHLPQSAYTATITANPNVNFEYRLFNGPRVYQGNTNLTGVFKFPEEVLKTTPLISIKLISESWGDEAYLTYGYYYTPSTSFSYIKSINVKDKIVQQSGLGIDINIIDNYKDIRTDMGEIHYLKVQKKFIEEITYDSSAQQYKLDEVTVLRRWDKNCLYLFNDDSLDQQYYIDGDNPPSLINSAQYKYNYPSMSILIPINTQDLFGFQLNDSNIIDFSGTGDTFGRYESLTGLSNVYRLSAGKGIIMDMVYQEKEITYSLEDVNHIVQTHKSFWLQKKNIYESSQTNGSTLENQERYKQDMESAYLTYINYLNWQLQRELEEAEEHAI